MKIIDILSAKSDYLLCEGSIDYADEFDVGFSVVMTKDDLIKTLDTFREKSKCWIDHEVYFGTNEFFQFSSLEDFMSHINLKTLTKSEYDTFVKFDFTDCVNNPFSLVETRIEYCDDDDDDDGWLT